MRPSAVPSAAKKGRHDRTATVATAMEMIAIATGLDAKCFLRYAPSVAKIPKYHSSPVKIDQYIAVIATIRSDLTGHASLLLKAHIGQVSPSLCVPLEERYTI